VRRSRRAQIAIERRERHSDALCNFGKRDVGLRKQRRRHVDVIVGQTDQANMDATTAMKRIEAK
jgi:hypothetical protein